MPEWIVDAPARIDTFLAAQGTFHSRGRAQKAIEGGHVTVNGKICTKASTALELDDRVVVSSSLTRSLNFGLLQPVDLHLPILFEDDACLVINKPAGIAVHPGAGISADEPTILSGVAHLFTERSLPFSASAVLVHRLDKETTGCLLIAKSSEAHHQLQKQFETRTVKKLYLALVAGIPSPATAIIDAPIGRSSVNRTRMSVLGVGAIRHAKTTYRTLGSVMVSPLAEPKPRGEGWTNHDGVALVECDLHTGRTHQVRVHMSSIGHPILGDDTYGNSVSEELSEELHIENLCLHAWKIQFHSPADGKQKKVEEGLPAAFAKLLKQLGLNVKKS